MIRIVVLISGGGSNLQSLLDQCQAGILDAQIGAVISNRPDAFGLSRARQAGVKALTLDHTDFTERAAFDRALAELVDAQQPDLIVLAGFMRILTDDFVKQFAGKMINIHPSLLPLYPGLNTHQRALDAGDSKAGATVHFVTAELDGGPAIARVEVDITDQDNAESLARKVLTQEHKLYPAVVDWFVKGRLSLNNNQALLDDSPLPKGGCVLDTAAL
ncbi:phosphoribosylglycinamide formyltransferase [Saccharospirillum impatiens]|uniref:phosphoribosylglycinamide formyltransferase n=1 Tax=Saccharospirillum impatiens TaxID=169438 RepID=UPI0004249F15|nr:phosphoribosylglycinamide formyltransferase [Saccharospirillum impatiens]